MFERFSDQARRVVVLAQEEARLLGHGSIGTGHLLLGVLHEDEGRGGASLRALGVDLEWARSRVEEVVGPGDRDVHGHIPFNDASKEALLASFDESRRRSEDPIATEDLLLGLFANPDGVACRVLAGRQIDRAAIEAALERLDPGPDAP